MYGLVKWRIASYLEVTLSQNETESNGRREMFDFYEGRRDNEGKKLLRVMDRQVYLSGGLEQTQQRCQMITVTRARAVGGLQELRVTGKSPRSEQDGERLVDRKTV